MSRRHILPQNHSVLLLIAYQTFGAKLVISRRHFVLTGGSVSGIYVTHADITEAIGVDLVQTVLVDEGVATRDGVVTSALLAIHIDTQNLAIVLVSAKEKEERKIS